MDTSPVRAPIPAVADSMPPAVFTPSTFLMMARASSAAAAVSSIVLFSLSMVSVPVICGVDISGKKMKPLARDA